MPVRTSWIPLLVKARQALYRASDAVHRTGAHPSPKPCVPTHQGDGDSIRRRKASAKQKLAAAMQRLLDAKRIRIVTEGSPSRERSPAGGRRKRGNGYDSRRLFRTDPYQPIPTPANWGVRTTPITPPAVGNANHRLAPAGTPQPPKKEEAGRWLASPLAPPL